MPDVIEIVGRSVVQHGPGNDRVYLMKLHRGDDRDIVPRLEELALSHGYSKIFAKVPARTLERFLAAGYEQEAAIPQYFPDGETACFLGKFMNAARRPERNPTLVREVLAAAESVEAVNRPAPLAAGFSWRVAREEDIPEMAAVYRQVFATYPFPIFDPAFLRTAMYDQTIYFGVWHGADVVALSSAEMDPSSRSAEMTDFATLPEYRGHGLALYLLRRMEETVQALGIRTFYTIARAFSHGMNITFARNGYRFGGTLTNNTNISGNLESMNVWYKTVPDAGRGHDRTKGAA